MANRNFNKQVIPARTKLVAGGTASDTGKRGGMGPMGPRVKPLPRFKKKDTTDREKIIRDRILNNKLKDIKPRDRTVDRMPMPREIDKMQPRQPMPTMPGRPRKPGPSRPMPKLPGRPRPPIRGLTPEQIKRLKELMKRRKGLDPKNPKFKKSIDSLKEKMQKTGRPRPKGRKKLMGGGSSSSREAMMHGFYNKDMGMGKKKK